MRKNSNVLSCGSANHGCEAIVRSTKKILSASKSLYTSAISEDENMGFLA